MATTPDGHKYEIRNFPYFPVDGWLCNFELAVDGILAHPFNVSIADRARYKREDDFVLMLVRQAQSLIDTYGDYRDYRQRQLAGTA